MDGLPAVLVGAMWYVWVYFGHSLAPSARFARFRAPRSLSRFFRRDPGDLLVSALALQAYAFALAVVGVLVIWRAIPAQEASEVQLNVAEYGILIVGAIWLLVIAGRDR